MANQTNSMAHTKWMCKYHIVFTPKYSISQFMGYLKGKSALMIYDKHANVTVHSYLVPVTDFADASHSKSAKSATTTVSYGIFSSENAYL